MLITTSFRHGKGQRVIVPPPHLFLKFTLKKLTKIRDNLCHNLDLLQILEMLECYVSNRTWGYCTSNRCLAGCIGYHIIWVIISYELYGLYHCAEMSLLVLLLGNWCVTLLVDATILLVVEDNNFYKFSSVSVLVKCVLVTQMVNFLKSTIENKKI